MTTLEIILLVLCSALVVGFVVAMWLFIKIANSVSLWR